MPYTPEHKAATRMAILEAARTLFNRKGYADVTIDEVMAEAGFTRGGFYNHFKNKADLFANAVASYHHIDPMGPAPELTPRELAHNMIDFYLSDAALGSEKLQCPLYALPSDVSRMGDVPRSAYAVLVRRTRDIFLRALVENPDSEQRAETITAVLVGAMTMSRAVNDPDLRGSLRASAQRAAHELLAGT